MDKKKNKKKKIIIKLKYFLVAYYAFQKKIPYPNLEFYIDELISKTADKIIKIMEGENDT